MNSTIKIESVKVKTGEGENGTWKLYRVEAADGKKYQTFDRGIGRALQSRVGKTIEVEWEAQERNGFTNRIISGIEGLEEDGDEPEENQAASSETSTETGQAGTGQWGRSPEVETRIVRESVLASAIRLLGIAAQTDPKRFEGKSLGELAIGQAAVFESWVYGRRAEDRPTATTTGEVRPPATATVAVQIPQPESNPTRAEQLKKIAKLFNTIGGEKAVETLAALGFNKAVGEMNPRELDDVLQALLATVPA